MSLLPTTTFSLLLFITILPSTLIVSPALSNLIAPFASVISSPPTTIVAPLSPAIYSSSPILTKPFAFTPIVALPSLGLFTFTATKWSLSVPLYVFLIIVPSASVVSSPFFNVMPERLATACSRDSTSSEAPDETENSAISPDARFIFCHEYAIVAPEVPVPRLSK